MRHDILLDDVLFGEPAWGQVVHFFKHADEFDTEEVSRAIQRWLMTEDDHATLEMYGLYIEDILEGDFPEDLEPVAVDLLEQWNNMVGEKVFTI